MYGTQPLAMYLPWRHAVALGHVPGVSQWTMMAHNASIGSTVETMSPEMGELMGRPEGAAFAVASSSTADTLLGTGARTVRAHYIDTANAIQSEDFEMDGQTEVQSDATDAAVVFCLEVLTSGTHGDTTGGNVGVLWAGTPTTFVAGVPAPEGGNRYASTQEDTGFSQCGAYRVPAGWKLLLTHVSMIGTSGKETEVWIYTRPPGGQWNGRPQANLSSGIYSDGAVFGTVLAAGSDIEIRAATEQAQEADIHVFLHGELHRV